MSNFRMTTCFDLNSFKHIWENHSRECAELIPLVGKPFKFIRVSYGDEMTIHFGDIRKSRSPKLNLMYGNYVLGTRGSSWLLNCGYDPETWIMTKDLAKPNSETITKNYLEEGRFMEYNSLVGKAVQFKHQNKNGLKLDMSDGSMLVIIPTKNEPDEYIQLADWELLTIV